MNKNKTQLTATELVERLNSEKINLNQIKCTIGFDGFIDEIFRVVKYRKRDDCIYFSNIHEYSEHIRESAGKSADMEIICQDTKLGGNAPIMANAIGRLGIQTTCIGALGSPKIHPAYQVMSSNCEIISIAEPAHTYAYEFNDGKLMYGNVGSLDKVRWEELKENIGMEKILDIFNQSSFIGVVNWRYLNYMDSILEGIVNEVFPLMDPDTLSSKILFFDIADPSGRSMEDLFNYMDTLKLISKHVKVILGVNEREALMVHKCLCSDKNLDNQPNGIKRIGREIIEQLNISTLFIHTLKYAIGFTAEETVEVEGKYIEKPLISTGGGDNFNAGFCLAKLLNLSLEQSLRVACEVSSFYVSKGYSPSFTNLIDYISEE